ncbi:PREDICTED: transmembrane protein 214 [Ceratosolen solmsi marchali]|uniref:Transmembrane protein 214 n=1 Tax=Ceratosolen solmsi marchali TaxID=326594 RepID=A0AAJ6YD76_9HYME|nr:PREDICTED: transmembrane protein 214 [Ceratosolen solmsi marchali]
MNGGVWEVVGKNKKEKNVGKVGKLSKVEKKKFIENAPKLEDFLPLDQVRSLYNNLDGNKENKKPVKEKESKTKENEEKKKQQRQLQIEKKKEEHPKEKIPKSIEEALNWIDVTEVQNLLLNHQARFPDAPLIWLKILVAFLNSKITVEKDDPVFSSRPSTYPLILLPKDLRNVFEKTIENAGASNIQLFYEFILTAMTTKMVKGVPVVGYKIFVQLLAKYDPKLSMVNIPKLISMRNSYQNRKPIGLSLLWSFNQGGRENLMIGLQVWHEVMSPMLEAKSYSSYIIQMLNDLLTWHSDEKNLQTDLYFNILEDFCSGKLNISQSVIDEGILILIKLRIILFKNNSINYRKLFETLFFKVTPKTLEKYKNESLKMLLNCVIHDEQCFNVWESLHMKNLFISSEFLKYIDSCWHSVHLFINTISFTNVLISFQSSYKKSKKGKRKEDKYLYLCSSLSKELLKRMCTNKSKKSSLLWKFGSFFLLFLLSLIVVYDIYKHESLEATNIGSFIRDKEITTHVQKTYVFIKSYFIKQFEYFEANFPQYYKTIVDLFNSYIKLINDVCLVAKSVIIQLYSNFSSYFSTIIPIVVAKIELYVPGLLDFIQQNASNGIQIMKIYAELMIDQIINNLTKVVRWLKTNVFIGKLSPENLQIYANQALNVTHTSATKIYYWVYKNMQTLYEVE